MDGSAFRHMGGMVSAVFTALAVLTALVFALIVVCIGMGIYIYAY